MTSSVLVTGHGGFLGSHVARHLAASGYRVTGIGHGTWDVGKDCISVRHIADVTLDSLVTYAGEPDVIIHCAGSGSVAFSMTHPFQDFGRTVSTTAAVLEYIRLHSPHSVLVYPSSAAVYGDAKKLPISEDSPLSPISPYGAHKLVAEQLCRSYARNFNVSVAMIRLFSIYGEGLRKQLLWDACSKIAQGEKNFFGTGQELRDWLHVEDAAKLIGCAIKNASPLCPVVNGGSGHGVSVEAVLSMLFNAYGVATVPVFQGQPRLGDPKGHQADLALVQNWLWHPDVALEDGVRRYVDWFKKR